MVDDACICVLSELKEGISDSGWTCRDGVSKSPDKGERHRLAPQILDALQLFVFEVGVCVRVYQSELKPGLL